MFYLALIIIFIQIMNFVFLIRFFWIETMSSSYKIPVRKQTPAIRNKLYVKRVDLYNHKIKTRKVGRYQRTYHHHELKDAKSNLAWLS